MFLEEVAEVLEHTGRHLGHATDEVGMCTYCSCGFRFNRELIRRFVL